MNYENLANYTFVFVCAIKCICFDVASVLDIAIMFLVRLRKITNTKI